MNSKRIVIVGCGNIGSRHLQAVASLPFPASVDIVEPADTARQIAKSRLEEIPYERRSFDFHWHSSIRDLGFKSDLAIVATSAVGRVQIIGQLLEAGHTRFLVEKMVCQSVREYDQLLAKMGSFGAKGWVNTPRRYNKSYRRIKERFPPSAGPIRMSVAAGNEGLGSNAIHFLDLFSWLCEDYEPTLSGKLLHNRLFPNKRGQDLVELAGTITGASRNGSVVEISFLPYDDGRPLLVDIFSKNAHLVIDESREKLVVLRPADGPDGAGFKNEYVSSTTAEIAKDILAGDSCALPSVGDSYFSHRELFRIFNAHIKKLTGQEREMCPVT